MGASSRKKVRYRWYGESKGPDAGTLEIKCKRNYFGWKLRYEIPDPPYAPEDGWRAVRRALFQQLPRDGRKWLEAYPFPMLISRYRREYFVSSDAKVRVTVDTEQSILDQRFKPYPNFDRRANYPHTLVVEFKFDRNDRDLASEILQGIPLRVSRHSKYINGVRVISGC